MSKEYKMISVTMDAIRDHNTANQYIVSNMLVANEMQLKHMQAYAPDYDMENFPVDYPLIGWLEETLAASGDMEKDPESPEYKLFAAALTITAITTRLEIPEEFYYLDMYVCEAVRQLTVTYAALQKAKAELEAGVGTPEVEGELMAAQSAHQDIVKDAMNAALAQMPRADEVVV